MACDSPFTVDRGPAYAATQRMVAVPCGRCAICKRTRINQWVFRLLQEDKHSTSSYFITLTYDTDHIPISENGFKTLQKSDYQKFMKRLRRRMPKHVRLKYYAVGEYGTKSDRPHYHAIIFNLPDPQIIEDAWTLGSIHFGTVSGNSIAYTAKYIDKDSRIPKHRNDDRVPEFSLMSKGLGKAYLTKAMTKYHKADLTRNYVVTDQRHKVPMPRYYKDKLFNDHELEVIRFLSRVGAREKEAQEQQEYLKQYENFMFPPSWEEFIQHKKEAREHRTKSPRNAI